MGIGWIITLCLLGVVIGVALIQYRAQTGSYRPLSSRQPERAAADDRPLGTEALDLDEIQRTQRRNESLERAHTNWNRKRGGLSGIQTAAMDIRPLADDETYARRFHAAFHKRKDKT